MRGTLWLVVLLMTAVAFVPIVEAAGTDPRTNLTGRSSAITVTVTTNRVSLTVSGNELVMDWRVEGTTTGTVDHLEVVLIEERRSGAQAVTDPIEETPDVSGGGFSLGFHGTGAGGSRTTWRHTMSGRLPLGGADSPDISSDIHRVIACYQGYGNAAETQWNFACVTVFGDGAGNTGSGDRTGGPAGAIGSATAFLLVVLIVVVVVFVILAVVLTRRRRSKMQPAPMQPPMQPPAQPPLPPR